MTTYIINGTFNSVTEMVEHLQSEDHSVTVVANPNIEAALEARFNYIDATVESVTEIAAAFDPQGEEQASKWWEVEHHPRCNIEVLGAEPLQPGGDCTCAAVIPPGDTEQARPVSGEPGSVVHALLALTPPGATK